MDLGDPRIELGGEGRASGPLERPGGNDHLAGVIRRTADLDDVAARRPASGKELKGCLEDPLLDESRYIYIETSVPTILAVARGHRGVADAIADGSVEVFGDPALVERLPSWFLPADAAPGVQAGGPVRRAADNVAGQAADAQAVVLVS